MDQRGVIGERGHQAPTGLDMPGPSRRITVEPLVLPAPARRPEPTPVPERLPQTPPERVPDPEPEPERV